MRIQIKIDEIELVYEENQQSDAYPRIVSGDRYKDGMSKSERMVEVVKEMSLEVVKMWKIRNENNVVLKYKPK